MIQPREHSTNPYEAPQATGPSQRSVQIAALGALNSLKSAVLYVLFGFLILRMISHVLVFFLQQR